MKMEVKRDVRISGYKIINTPDISNKIKSHGGNTMYYYDK
jgi:hypothetical protein